MDEQESPNRTQHGDIFILGGNFVMSSEDRQQIRQDNVLKAIRKGEPKNSDAAILLSEAYVAFDAMHTSDQRYPPPRCHPGTRDAVLRLIAKWISARHPPQSIFWLYGTAGVGKSAIMQTTCETFLAEGGHVPAAFFFGRGQGQRANGRFLASTIAFQLVQNLPGYRKGLDKVFASHPHLHKQSISAQFTALLIDAINRIPWWSSWRMALGSPITIVVDGLDECDGEETQSTIIELLHEAVNASKKKLRFLIASRPESHILAAFNQPEVSQITKRVPLDDTFKPADAIRLYLRAEFQQIASTHPGLLPSSGWPPDGTIEILVQAAWGQFIFVYLVIAFVRMPRQDPQQQLQIVLDATRNAVAFSPLDALYTQILDNIPSEHRVVLTRVIGCIVVIALPLPISDIASLVSVDVPTAKLVLDQLRAVLLASADIPRLFIDPVRFAHASFRDYLVDPNRSGRYTVDQPACNAILVRRYLHTLPLNSNAVADLPHPHHTLSNEACYYLDSYIQLHLQRTRKDLVTDDILARADALFFNPAGYPPHTCPPIDTYGTRDRSTLFQQCELLTALGGTSKWVSFDAIYGRFLARLASPDQPQGSAPVLGCLAHLKTWVSCGVIADILGMSTADVEATLVGLHPLISTTSRLSASTSNTIALNRNFRAFLQDPTRAGDGEQTVHRVIVLLWLQACLTRRPLRAETARYLDEYVVAHASECDAEELCQDLSNQIPPDFVSKQPVRNSKSPWNGTSGLLERRDLQLLRDILSAHTKNQRVECPHTVQKMTLEMMGALSTSERRSSGGIGGGMG